MTEAPEIKLNIGAGSTVIEGFTPIDRKLGSEAYPLPFPDGSVSEIRASHILEHFTFGEAQKAMAEWSRVLKPGGTLSSLGVYSGDLTIPLDAFAAGLGDHRINTALCPGGKERMRRLMNVLESSRLDLGLLVTHEYKLDDIVAAYELFANQRDGVLKVAVKPG